MRYATMALSTLLLAAALVFAQGTPPAGGAPAAAAPAGEGPTDVVQTAAQGMLGELDTNRDAYRHDPSKVVALVDKYLLPHFDTEYAARGWCSASTGARRPPSSASASSTPSTTRC